jgi:hypothetical protein
VRGIWLHESLLQASKSLPGSRRRPAKSKPELGEEERREEEGKRCCLVQQLRDGEEAFDGIAQPSRRGGLEKRLYECV